MCKSTVQPCLFILNYNISVLSDQISKTTGMGAVGGLKHKSLRFASALGVLEKNSQKSEKFPVRFGR